MPPDLSDLRWFTPAVSDRYPHMSAADTAVWRQFVGAQSHIIDKVAYDVHVGSLPPLPPNASRVMKLTAAGVSVKRIDALALVRGVYWIIELKPYGNAAGLGQCILYRDTFLERYGESVPILPVILCNELDRDVARVAPAYGIHCIALNIPFLF